MPQLNPAPWFTILLSTWLILLVVLTPKVLTHTFPYAPDPATASTSKTQPWPWQWH
uniref:ATP synthase complex subunit 8 n=1 Tax=Caulophryne jordani TaxID=717990 RepID=Q8HM23_CAUJO|nr:ATP synthase F0 subunit 8 [Caulophryne jordani]BAC23337.1 ATPase subunit 8 [Caulophryne jordani]